MADNAPNYNYIHPRWVAVVPPLQSTTHPTQYAPVTRGSSTIVIGGPALVGRLNSTPRIEDSEAYLVGADRAVSNVSKPLDKFVSAFQTRCIRDWLYLTTPKSVRDNSRSPCLMSHNPNSTTPLCIN